MYVMNTFDELRGHTCMLTFKTRQDKVKSEPKQLSMKHFGVEFL